MAKNLIFKDADAVKSAIMDSQKKEITALYEKWADEGCDTCSNKPNNQNEPK